MIANIQGYQVSVVTLALPPFLSIPPSKQSAAPVLLLHTNAASLPAKPPLLIYTRTSVCTRGACAKRDRSCGAPGPGATVCLSHCLSPAMLHQHLAWVTDRTWWQRLAPQDLQHLVEWQVRIGGVMSKRAPPHPRTSPRVKLRNEVPCCCITAAPMPSCVAEGNVSLACLPARMTQNRLRLRTRKQRGRARGINTKQITPWQLCTKRAGCAFESVRKEQAVHRKAGF